MAPIAILPVETESGETTYHAVAGDRRVTGRTAGEALDALHLQLSEEEIGSLVVVQHMRPDRFFNANQLNRLAELMGYWRECRDRGETLSQDEQAELEELIELETRASTERTAAIANELAP